MNFKGIIPAIVTPMDPQGQVDEAALRAYLKWILPQKPVALALNTDAGEGPLLSPAEKLRILEVAASEVAGQVPLICGLAGADQAGMLDFGKKAKARGADAWLVFPHPTFRGGEGRDPLVIDWHRQVARLKLPIVLFQLQAGLGGIELNEPTMEALVNIDEVQAVKEATFDAFKFQRAVEFFGSLKKKITVLTGNDNFILESFMLGGTGALIGFGAILTKEQVEMVRLLKKGETAKALKLYARVNALAQYCFGPPVRDYRARLKEALRLQGVIPSNGVRAPLRPIDRKQSETLRRLLKTNKFL